MGSLSLRRAVPAPPQSGLAAGNRSQGVGLVLVVGEGGGCAAWPAAPSNAFSPRGPMLGRPIEAGGGGFAIARCPQGRGPTAPCSPGGAAIARHPSHASAPPQLEGHQEVVPPHRQLRLLRLELLLPRGPCDASTSSGSWGKGPASRPPLGRLDCGAAALERRRFVGPFPTSRPRPRPAHPRQCAPGTWCKDSAGPWITPCRRAGGGRVGGWAAAAPPRAGPPPAPPAHSGLRGRPASLTAPPAYHPHPAPAQPDPAPPQAPQGAQGAQEVGPQEAPQEALPPPLMRPASRRPGRRPRAGLPHAGPRPTPSRPAIPPLPLPPHTAHATLHPPRTPRVGPHPSTRPTPPTLA